MHQLIIDVTGAVCDWIEAVHCIATCGHYTLHWSVLSDQLINDLTVQCVNGLN